MSQPNANNDDFRRHSTAPDAPPNIPDHELIKPIGKGSYGEVWLARNIMGEYRAVKVVYRKSFQDDRPFQRELAGIRNFEPISRSHEGFIDILHIGLNEPQGYFFYVMELGDDQNTGTVFDPESYVTKTLAKSISLHGRLSFEECLKLGLGISRALAELHTAGLVHRDVKPSNIIFVNGVPKLADIGLVTEAQSALSYVGTEGFIPPEGPGRPPADIYGLGKTLYEVSTGKDRTHFPELPGTLDGYSDQKKFLELNEVILRACQNDILARYASAWDMHTDLVMLADGKSIKRLRILELRMSKLKRMGLLLVLVLGVLSLISYPLYRGWKQSIEMRERQVGADIAYGNQALKAGDLLGALPHYVDAFRADFDNQSERSTHRLRLEAVLRQCPKLTHLWSEAQPVIAGAFSPDGKKVVVAGENEGKLKVYDLQSGKLEASSTSDISWVNGASYSPDGRWIASGNWDKAAYVWDAKNLVETNKFLHPDRVESVRFSPDGHRLLTSCRDGIARLWNLESHQLELSFRHLKKLRFADMSQDGKWVATASEDGTACIWDAKDGRQLRVLPHETWVNYVSFSPDGHLAITACADHKARIWNADTGQRVGPDLVHGDVVESAVFSPDGATILTAGLDGCARLLETDTMQPINVNHIFKNGERLHSAAFDATGRQIITAGMDGTVRIWDFSSSIVCPKVTLLTPDQDDAFFIITNNCVAVQKADVSQPAKPFALQEGVVGGIPSAWKDHFIVKTNGALGHSSRSLSVWDCCQKTMVGPPISILDGQFKLSQDGQYLVSYLDRTVQIWETGSAKKIGNACLHSAEVEGVYFSPNNKYVVTTCANQAFVWNTKTGQSCYNPIILSNEVHMVAFSQDGSKLVVCGSDNLLTKCYAQICDTETGQAIGSKLVHGDGVLAAAFSPDDKSIVTASEDFTAVVWDATTGKRLISPVELPEQVVSARFSPDGKWFVTVCADKAIRLWSTSTGDPLTPPMRYTRRLEDAWFLAGDHGIVARVDNGEVICWELNLDLMEAQDLATAAGLLTSTEEGRFSSLNLQPTNSLETTWKYLRNKYPERYEVTDKQIAVWHEHQARKSESAGRKSAAVFHWKQIQRLRPNDATVTKHLDGTFDSALKQWR